MAKTALKSSVADEETFWLITKHFHIFQVSSNFEDFQSTHRRWVQSVLSDGRAKRDDSWVQNIATESQSFVDAVKSQMHGLAIGRSVRKKVEGFELRKAPSPYKALLDTEKSGMESENLWFLGENKRISICYFGQTPKRTILKNPPSEN